MPDHTPSSPLDALRAIDELRRQLGIVIRDNDFAFGNYPLEALTEELLATFRDQLSQLLITAPRAQALGLEAQDIKIDIENWPLPNIMALGDPLATAQTLPELHYTPASEIDSLALKLAKQASLLPALLRLPSAPPEWLAVEAASIRDYFHTTHHEVMETAHARLPMKGLENASIIGFRTVFNSSVHLAIVVGDITNVEAPLTRIHSSCFTGDILGSLRCDCGEQLQRALAAIAAEGCGVLVYLHQEGRGIGLTNKLRAYQLQERGIDTYDANLMLGFEEDERDFGLAAAILKKLGISRIRMLTNNPHKLAAMEKAGIKVLERVPLIAPSGAHNHDYLSAKGHKAGHLF